MGSWRRLVGRTLLGADAQGVDSGVRRLERAGWVNPCQLRGQAAPRTDAEEPMQVCTHLVDHAGVTHSPG